MSKSRPQIKSSNSRSSGPLRPLIEASSIKAITISGENQTGVGGQQLPEPFVVFVHDSGGNPVQGVPVIFEVLQGGSNFSSQPTVTRTSDSDGRAAAVLTLGPQEGLNNNVVNVTFPGLPGLPAVFTASGFASGNAEDTRKYWIIPISLSREQQPGSWELTWRL